MGTTVRAAGATLVISPHCDDGVLSCGDLLAHSPGATVLTVFAGDPPAGAPITEWDAAAGFGPDDAPMAVRRAEDAEALAVLGARPWWLDFRDAQYGAPASVEAIAAAIAAVVEGADPATVVAPLGLFHSDHRLAHEAALRARDGSRARWMLYADALYRRIPGLLPERLAALADGGLRLEPVAPLEAALPLKRRAVACYRSQLRALATPGRPGHADAFAAEQYWRIVA